MVYQYTEYPRPICPATTICSPYPGQIRLFHQQTSPDLLSRPTRRINSNFWSSGGFLNDLLIVGIAFLVYWIYAVARLAYVETEHTV